MHEQQKRIELLEEKISILEKNLTENNTKIDELTKIIKENYIQKLSKESEISKTNTQNMGLKNNIQEKFDKNNNNENILKKIKEFEKSKYMENITASETENVSNSKNNTKQRKLVRRAKGKTPKTNNEQMIGKYLIGALSALLLFIATGSFVSIIWQKITDDVKLGMIFAIGIALSSLGYFFIRKDKNPIFSIILGAGAGVTYIGIISANLAFHKINSGATLILCLLWAMLFIALSNNINVFFTTIIAYIGSYITLLLGSMLIHSEKDALMLTIFAIIVTVAMVGNTYMHKKEKLRTTIYLSFITCITLYIITVRYENVRPISLVIQAILLLLAYKIENEQTEHKNNDFIILTLTYASNLAFHILINVSENIIKFFQKYSILFVIAILFFIIINIFFKKLVKKYEPLYAIFMCFTVYGMHNSLDDYMFGFCIVCLILIILSMLFKRDINYKIITIILSFDSLMSFIWLLLDVDYATLKPLNIMHYIYNVVNIMIIGTIVFIKYKKKDFKELSKYKIIAMIITIVAILYIGCFIKCGIGDYPDIIRFYDALTYSTLVIMMIILNMIGYFKDWSDEKFALVSHKNAVEDANLMFTFYIVTTILYIFGIATLNITNDKEYIVYINTIALVAITVLQSSKMLLNKQDYHIHILIGIKYLILTFTILNGVLHIETASFIYNIAGLLIALSSISIGFKLDMKGLREYGLFLTILVVIKFILVDMQGENSINRVLSLVVGAIFCFSISFIYNKLSDKYKEKNSEN